MSRPHLSANHKLPFQTAAELLGAPLEKIQDLLDQYSETD